MAELEKVIKGLECCEFNYYCPEECPYKPQENCVRYLHNDAIELLKEQEDLGAELTNAVELIHKKNERIEKLLKEQEAVEPIPPTDESDLWKCGNCNHQLFRCTHQRYCEMCGRQVKWG